MLPTKAIVYFLLRFLGLYAVLMTAWWLVGGVFIQTYASGSEFLYGHVGDGGSVKMQRLAEPMGDFDTGVELTSTDQPKTIGQMELSLWNLAYKPTVILLALVLASPVSWSQRGQGLLIGLVILQWFVMFRIGMTLWQEFAMPGPLQTLYWSETWASWMRQLRVILVDTPASFFVVPIFIWLVATFRREDWVRVMAGSAAKPVERP